MRKPSRAMGCRVAARVAGVASPRSEAASASSRAASATGAP
ncbi:hypothetical protein ACIU1J_07945 [Azospirillum doebereinerae]